MRFSYPPYTKGLIMGMFDWLNRRRSPKAAKQSPSSGTGEKTLVGVINLPVPEELRKLPNERYRNYMRGIGNYAIEDAEKHLPKPLEVDRMVLIEDRMTCQIYLLYEGDPFEANKVGPLIKQYWESHCRGAVAEARRDGDI